MTHSIVLDRRAPVQLEREQRERAVDPSEGCR
jgi:hypothetical protein